MKKLQKEVKMFSFNKKKLLTAFIFISLGSISLIRAAGEPAKDWGALQAITGNLLSGPTIVYLIDRNGNVLPGANNVYTIGEASHAWQVGWFGQVNIASGSMTNEAIIAPRDGFNVVITSVSIATQTLVGSGTTYSIVDYSTQPAEARNLLIFAAYPAGSSTHTVIGSALIIGTDTFGKAMQETIGFSTNTTQGTGSVAWNYISSITITASSVSAVTETPVNVSVFITLGKKLGLEGVITSTGDVINVSCTQAVTPGQTRVNSYIVDPVNSTVWPDPAPNGVRSYAIRYKQRNSTP